MSEFRNGHLYECAIALAPPPNEGVPYINVEMALDPSSAQPVVGKLDTGAFMTMLTFETGFILGLHDPTADFLRTDTAHAANDQEFPYYVHRIFVTVPSPAGQDLNFPLEAGFADAVNRNLFGIDWLAHMCVAIDSEQVHVLRD